jgi:hypothetical protein
MKRDHGGAQYTTHSVADKKEGYAGMELHRTSKSKTERVARVLFWDASGQFFIGTFNADLPVDIVEELIAETKAAIKTK